MTMNMRKITEKVFWLGAVDWDRRLFDSLIPLPDGTSYNAYLVRGSDKTALIDSVDPAMTGQLMEQLEGVESIDFVVAHHAEQDHSGTIPVVLEKYPGAKVIATPKGKELLMIHLGISPERFIEVEDGRSISLGDKNLQFFHTPWVHWPETMVTWLAEDRILFSCDFFGSHIATNELYVTDKGRVYEAAKRYFAEIMMPFRNVIEKNIAKVKKLDIGLIAPSHGAVYDEPDFIISAYEDWVSSSPKNIAVIPYITMHGSTALLVNHLVAGLTDRGVRVEQFNLADTDIGKLAMALVDAATIVIGAPTVLTGAHPRVAYAAFLANALRPKARFASIIGSYGWGTRVVEQLSSMIPNLKAEIIPPVLCKGLPREADLDAVDALAGAIADRHKEAGIL